MNKTKLIIAVGLALQTHIGYGYTFAANTGQLSYTFFNLGPNSVTVTPYGGGANSYGQAGSLSTTTGWDNSGGSYGTAGDLSMFNSGLTPQTAKKYCSDSSYNLNSPIFFASNGDPLATLTAKTISSGNQQSFLEQSGQSAETLNPPAMADSWSIYIDGNDSIVIANMATSSNMLVSGNNYFTANWPFCQSSTGEYYNADLNPSDPYNMTATSYTPPGASSSISQWTNPFGAGFVPAGQTWNLNVSPTDPSYSPMGGLWSGVNVNNGSNVAANSLSSAMYPINLTSYVQPTAARTVSGSGAINGTAYEYSNQYYASIYGGHFTYVVGDPYVINSAATKMLWTWVTSPSYQLTTNSMSASDITTIQGIVAGAYETSSTLSKYGQWLVGSSTTTGAAQLAAQAFANATAATTPPITSTKESLWGKAVNGILRVAVDALEIGAAIETGGASYEAQFAVGAATDATGAFGSVVTDAITKDFTTTTTLSPAPPQSQTAPPIINNTYAASNLFGMILANSFVQAEVNIANNETNNPGEVLWNSASINVDGLCETGTATSGAYTVGASANLIGGSCYTTNSSGTLNNGSNGTTVQTFNNTSGQTQLSYSNPLSLYDNSQSTSQISLWNSILTGADITTNSNGVMKVGNPILPAFSPPVQLVVAGGAYSPITNVNTAFNLSSGMLSVASYTTNGNEVTEPTRQPAAAPVISSYTGMLPSNPAGNPAGVSNYQITAGNYGPYNPSTGIFTYSSIYNLYSCAYMVGNGCVGAKVIGYNLSFTNSPATLDMMTCAVGSNINVAFDTTNLDYTTGAGASVTLSCTTTAPVAATGNYAKPANWPNLSVTVNYPNNTPNSTWAYLAPAVSSGYPPAQGAYYYDASNGFISVNGYFAATYGTGLYYAFANGGQSFSLTNCPDDAVTLTITPSTTTGDGSGASGALSCTTSPTSPPSLSMVVNPTSTNNPVLVAPTQATVSPPATGSYYYDSSTATLTVNGYYDGSNNAYAFANGTQSLSLSNCGINAVILTITPSTTPGAAGASGALSCGMPLQQPNITVVNSAASAANNTIKAANISFNGTTLTVGGFTVGTATAVTSFTNIDPSQPNGALTLDVSTCNQNMVRSTLAYSSTTSSYGTNLVTVTPGVTLTVYPIGTSNAAVMGVLSCQSPPTLPYNACTSDPLASGGVVAVLTGPALPNPQGPTFELACTCIPSYVKGGGGPNPVVSNAATTQSNFTSNNFIATGGNDSSGNPNGIVVGATSTYPSQQCPTNWATGN
ncbi:MAG: hypothetical protein ACKN9T_08630 [Candidatus Methylumidiphilus sp.]